MCDRVQWASTRYERATLARRLQALQVHLLFVYDVFIVEGSIVRSYAGNHGGVKGIWRLRPRVVAHFGSLQVSGKHEKVLTKSHEQREMSIENGEVVVDALRCLLLQALSTVPCPIPVAWRSQRARRRAGVCFVGGPNFTLDIVASSSEWISLALPIPTFAWVHSLAYHLALNNSLGRYLVSSGQIVSKSHWNRPHKFHLRTFRSDKGSRRCAATVMASVRVQDQNSLVFLFHT